MQSRVLIWFYSLFSVSGLDLVSNAYQMGRWHNLLEILICLDWTYHFALSVRERKGYNATWSIYQLNLYQYEFRVRPTSHCDGRHIGHYSTFFKGPGLAWPEREWCKSGRILCWFHIRKVSTSGFVHYSKQCRQADQYPSLVMVFNILRRAGLSTRLTSPTAMASLQAGRKTKPWPTTGTTRQPTVVTRPLRTQICQELSPRINKVYTGLG